MELYDKIREHYGGLEAEGVISFFDMLGLPVPEQGEYYQTSDTGFLIPLDDLGVLIRVTNDDDFPNYNHVHVLDPLFSRSFSGLRVDIMPGVEAPVTKQEAGILKRELYFRCGIELCDGHPYNFGFLPGTDPRFPVIIDEIGITYITKPSRALDEYVPAGKEPDTYNPQEELYGEIKRQMSAAWPSHSLRPDPEKFHDAFKQCHAMKEKGKLVSAWQDVEADYTQVPRAGRLYGTRLAQERCLKL